jgi:hypothetical protein
MPPSDIIDSRSLTRDFDKIRRSQGKVKFPQCRRCRFDKVCEGPWKEYPERFGSDEFVPVPGKKVKDQCQIIKHDG